MTTRRKFFKFLGLGATAAVTSKITANSISNSESFKLEHTELSDDSLYFFANNWQQKMSLDLNGTLHLGTNTPSTKLNVRDKHGNKT